MQNHEYWKSFVSKARRILIMLNVHYRYFIVVAITSYFQVQWLPWMHGLPRFVVEPETKFADIIVPTPDTVRSSALLELLLKNNKTVSLSITTTLTNQSIV